MVFYIIDHIDVCVYIIYVYINYISADPWLSQGLAPEKDVRSCGLTSAKAFPSPQT